LDSPELEQPFRHPPQHRTKGVQSRFLQDTCDFALRQHRTYSRVLGRNARSALTGPESRGLKLVGRSSNHDSSAPGVSVDTPTDIRLQLCLMDVVTGVADVVAFKLKFAAISGGIEFNVRHCR